jgi:hypothetical protein
MAHIFASINWMLFMLLYIKTKEKMFINLSLFFMIIHLFLGTKVILSNPLVAKSGNWLHLKLTFDILLMMENLYLYFKEPKKFMFWLTYFGFMLMLILSILKPF